MLVQREFPSTPKIWLTKVSAGTPL